MLTFIHLKLNPSTAYNMNKKRNIAVLSGGDGAERDISLKSAQNISDALDPERYTVVPLLWNQGDIIFIPQNIPINRNDFSLQLEDQTIHFDYCFLIIHGPPVENGKLQAYFEWCNIPYSTSDTFVSALTFNKYFCNDVMRTHHIHVADSMLLRNTESWTVERFEKLGFPLFIKPNQNGSSYGVTKVFAEEDIPSAIEFGFKYVDELIIEQFLQGREFTCGVVRVNNQLHILPVTEIITDNEYFDFSAKYENESQEITPANISPDLSHSCQEITAKIYDLLGAKGMLRMDYILVENTFYLIEVNTVPGMTNQSLFPQQLEAYGWTLAQLLDAMIEDACG